MQVIINKNQFIKQLRSSASIITENNLNPIVNCVLIKFLKNKVIFVSCGNNINSNIELSLEYELDEGFDILVKPKILLNIISKIKEDKVTLIKNIDRNLILKSKDFQCELNLLEDSNYPIIDYDLNSALQIIKIKLEDLNSIVNKLSWLASINENTKSICGINFNFKASEQKLICMSTDSYRVCKIETKLNDIKQDINLSIESKVIEKVVPILSDQSNSNFIDMYIYNNQIIFKTNSILITLKTIIDKYPDIEKNFYLPENITFRVDKQNLISAVEKALIIASSEKSTILLFFIDNDKIEIEAKSVELGSCWESILIQQHSGDKIVLKLNGNYLSHLLKVLDQEQIQFKITANDKPIIMTGVDNPNFEELILPIRIIE